MPFVKWLIAGVVGAAIGGAVWVLVAYFANLEVGYIAWGIGFLAGLGVRRSMETAQVSTVAGIAAVAAALLVILGSKYYVAHMHVENALGPLRADAAQSDPVKEVAGDIVVEREQAGQAVNWPKLPADAELNEDVIVEIEFPADVLEEARARWDSMPDADRTQYQESRRAERVEKLEEFRSVFREEAFKRSFGPFDLLWFGLAMMTAFKIGKGSGTAPAVQQPTEPAAPGDGSQPPAEQA